MTSTRAERKSSLVAVLAQLGLGIALGLAPRQVERAAASERIVTDWHTGLALYGFDPSPTSRMRRRASARRSLSTSTGGCLALP